MSLAATEDRGLVDMTATVGARAADDDEVDALGLSAVFGRAAAGDEHCCRRQASHNAP